MHTSAAQAQDFALRGFGDVGGTRFTATESFTAVLGSPGGVVYGGGVEAVFAQSLFVSFRASRFQKDGTRVFVFEGEPIDLGIATTVKVTPIELTVGYRFTLANASPGSLRGWRHRLAPLRRDVRFRHRQ